MKNNAADIKSCKFVIVSFDTLPSQIKLLDDLSKDGKVPPITDTGVDIVNSSNVDKFVGGK